MLRRADDVGEEKRRQDALTLGRQQPLQDARPLDRDRRLVADRPAIVTRRDIVDGSGARLQRRAVGELHADAAGQHDADVADLASFGANDRLDVRRPPPSWRVRRAGDGQRPELDDLLDDARSFDDPFGAIERLRYRTSKPVRGRGRGAILGVVLPTGTA